MLDALTRRRFLALGATAVASVVLAPAVDNLLGFDAFHFNAKAFAASNVRFHDSSELSLLDGQYVCSTVTQPSSIAFDENVALIDGWSYTVFAGKTGTIRLHNCVTDFDGDPCDVVLVIGPVKTLTPKYNSWPADHRSCLHFYTGGDSKKKTG